MVFLLAPLVAALRIAPDTPLTGEPVRLAPYPQLIATRYTVNEGLPPGDVVRVQVVGKRVFAATPHAVAELDGPKWRTSMQPPVQQMPDGIDVDVLPRGEPLLSWARTRSGGLWIVTTRGAFRREAGRWMPLDLPRLYKPHQPIPNIDSVIRFVLADGSGQVWIASDQGVYITDGDNWWHPLNRTDGMPYEDVLCLAMGRNGDLWGGTTEGAWRLRSGHWRYFWGKRWMPGNRVSSVAIDAAGAVWLGTDGGVAKIEEVPTRLADKAAHYEAITQSRHSRRGWVTACDLKTVGDPSAGIVQQASDNDGLWTAIYVSAEAFRYAATGETAARAAGRKSLEALLDLVRLSGYPGFPARAILRRGETASGYDPNETVRVPGETDKIWYTSPRDPNLLCKGDTSSDELDGHYFAWYVCYEHIADDAEKAEIRDVVRAVTTNLLDHAYTLVGPTGRKTRWGVFGPQFLNDDPRWWDERGLNSTELLCYLKVAGHICGDKRFVEAYNDLVDRHHYLLNTLNYRLGLPWHSINHSDDELAWLVYYPLLMLEREPSRRVILLQTVTSAWKGLKDERSPFYNFITGAGTGDGSYSRVEESLETLRDWPWDLVDWDVRNTHRHDVTLRTAPGIRRNEIDRVLPISERPLMRWNGNPWEPDGGSGGRSEEDGAAWLLPYWMGRYHRFIAE